MCKSPLLYICFSCLCFLKIWLLCYNILYCSKCEIFPYNWTSAESGHTHFLFCFPPGCYINVISGLMKETETSQKSPNLHIWVTACIIIYFNSMLTAEVLVNSCPGSSPASTGGEAAVVTQHQWEWQNTSIAIKRTVKLYGTQQTDVSDHKTQMTSCPVKIAATAGIWTRGVEWINICLFKALSHCKTQLVLLWFAPRRRNNFDKTCKLTNFFNVGWGKIMNLQCIRVS